MNRRAVIKNLALIVGGTVLLPSCLNQKGGAAIKLKNLALDADQQQMIADICETIIPKTTTPGAKDLNLPAFVLKMLDDCYKKKDQQTFIVGLGQFTDLVEKKYNTSFSELSVKDRESLLMELNKHSKPVADNQKGIKPVSEAGKSLDAPEKKQEIPPPSYFYSAIRQQTVFGYTNSQYFMTKQVIYELVPGRYNAHFPIKNIKTV